jgi:hypothetical protein
VEAKTLPDLKDLKIYLERETTETITAARPARNGVAFKTNCEPSTIINGGGNKQMVQLAEAALTTLNTML